jgi:hypothetical protein
MAKLNTTLRDIKYKITELKQKNGVEEKKKTSFKVPSSFKEDAFDDLFGDYENYDTLVDDLEMLGNIVSPTQLNSANSSDYNVFIYLFFILMISFIF